MGVNKPLTDWEVVKILRNVADEFHELEKSTMFHSDNSKVTRSDVCNYIRRALDQIVEKIEER